MQEFRENSLKAGLDHILMEICDLLNSMMNMASAKFDACSFFTDVHMNFPLILTSDDSKSLNTKSHQELRISVRAREGYERCLQFQY